MIYFHPSLILLSKARSLPMSPISSSLANKYKTWVKVNVSGKHTSLLQYDNNFTFKMFYSTDPMYLFYRTFKLAMNAEVS